MSEKLLPEGYHFRIFDAYRSIAVQQALWDYYKKKKGKNIRMCQKQSWIS